MGGHNPARRLFDSSQRSVRYLNTPLPRPFYLLPSVPVIASRVSVSRTKKPYRVVKKTLPDIMATQFIRSNARLAAIRPSERELAAPNASFGKHFTELAMSLFYPIRTPATRKAGQAQQAVTQGGLNIKPTSPVMAPKSTSSVSQTTSKAAHPERTYI